VRAGLVSAVSVSEHKNNLVFIFYSYKAIKFAFPSKKPAEGNNLRRKLFYSLSILFTLSPSFSPFVM
jgi:hypothetical protein